MECKQRSVIEELHRVGLPMTSVGAVGEAGWTLGDRHSADDVQGGAAAFTATVAALGFTARQIASPGVVLRPGDLGVDEAVDRLVADDALALLQRQTGRNRLGRQISPQKLENLSLKPRLAEQFAALPASGMGLLSGVGRCVTA